MADEQSWRLHSPITNSTNSEASTSCDNPLDWTCEDVKGRATGLFFPLEKDDVLVKEGDIVHIREQTLGGDYFVVFNQRSGKTGRVPVDYIDIISDDIDQIPLPVKTPPTRAGQGLHRQLGVSRRKGIEVRQRMSGANYSTTSTSEENGERSMSQSFTFPRSLSKRVSITSPPTTAQSLVVASIIPDNSTATKDRSTTAVPPTEHMTGEVPLESHPATVTTASAAKDDDVTEYEAGFRLVEQYNIVSVSGCDRDGRPVIVFSACRLPPSYKINHDVLLRYLKYTLDKIVEQDYTLLYCHYGFSSHNKPRFSWIKQVYREMDRKYKKNIKKLYILHPTNFIRVAMSLMKPFINYKFGRKMSYVNRLAELENVLYLDQLDIPEEVKMYDHTLRTPVRHIVSSDSRSVFHTPLPRRADDLTATTASKKQFGVPLEKVDMDENHIPRVLSTCVQLLEKKGMDVVGIFRRSPATVTIQSWKKRFNEGEEVDLGSHGDPHLAAVLIKLFLRELPEPLLTFNLYERILELSSAPEEEKVARARDMVQSLPPVNLAVLQYLITFLAKVAEREEANKMSTFNISIVIGPNLAWSTNAVASLTALGEINAFTLLLLNHHMDIFKQNPELRAPTTN